MFKEPIKNDQTLYLRIAGLAIILGTLLALDFDSITALHKLWLPLLLALGAYLALQNLLPVVVTIAIMTMLRTSFSVDHWIPSIAYPLLAAASTVATIVILVQRFRNQVEDTRDARKAARAQRRDLS